MEKVTHLFLVSDASKKGLQVATSIRQVAEELVMFEKCGLILNRVDNSELLCMPAPDGQSAGVEVLCVIPGDPAHARNDILGKSIFELPADAPVLRGAEEALRMI